MAVLKAGDLKMLDKNVAFTTWVSCHGHTLTWRKADGEVSLRTPEGRWLVLESAESAVEAKRRYVHFRETDQ